jgi:hypothetical protein
MGPLLTIGVVFVSIGVILLLLGSFITEQTVIAYFRLTGKKLNYITTRKFYWFSSISLITVGIIMIIVNAIRLLNSSYS